MRKTSHTHTHKQDNVTNKPPKQTNKKGKKSNLGTSLSTLRHFQIALYNQAIYFYFSIFLSHRATSTAFLLEKKNPSTLHLKKYFFFSPFDISRTRRSPAGSQQHIYGRLWKRETTRVPNGKSLARLPSSLTQRCRLSLKCAIWNR